MSQYEFADPKSVQDTTDAPPPKSGMSGCLIGCVVVAVVSLAVCGGAGVYVWMQAATWATDATTYVMKEGIKASQMREADKTAVIAEIDRVADGFKSDKITSDELGEIMEALMESPLISLLIITEFQNQQLERSGLSQEEKEAARLTLQRVTRGVAERKITNQDLEPAMMQVTQASPDDGDMSEPPMTDEEWRQYLASLESLAESKSVEAGEFQLDVAKELRRIVDEAVPGKLP